MTRFKRVKLLGAYITFGPLCAGDRNSGADGVIDNIVWIIFQLFVFKYVANISLCNFGSSIKITSSFYVYTFASSVSDKIIPIIGSKFGRELAFPLWWNINLKKYGRTIIFHSWLTTKKYEMKLFSSIPIDIIKE